MMESAMHFEDLSMDGFGEMLANYYQKEANLQEDFVQRVMSGQSDEYGGE